MPDEPANRDRRATDGLDWGTRQAYRPSYEQGDRDEASPPPPSPAAPRPRGMVTIAGVAVGSALIGGLAAGLLVAAVTGGSDSGSNVAATTGGSSPSTLSVQQTSAIAEVATKARPGVIKLESTRKSQAGAIEQDVGSGVVVDAEGHVVTNAHVVLGTETLKAIMPDGTERPAILVGHDFPFTDLAVVQIGPSSSPPIPVGDSSKLQLGETVIAIGNPLAEFDGSVTVGVVSGLNRIRNYDAVRYADLIQTDAAVNNGNSGGALLNLSGQFVGMPTSVLRESGGGASVEGMAFAIPSNRVMEVAKRIIAEGKNYPRPTLGLDHLDLSPEVAARLPRLNADKGAFVAQVAAGGPGALAGIERGDIITRIGDVDLTPDVPLLNALMNYQPGDKVRVVLNRGGRIIETEVRLAARG